NKESETLDFKRDQYTFYNCSKSDKAELLKDILAFANAWKTADAYILIGVEEQRSGPATLVGVTEHLKDNDLQQFVNFKTNKPIKFLCGTVKNNGQEIDVIRIDRNQRRPVVLKSNFEKLEKDTVYLRRGSSTEIAKVDEIAEMGASRGQSVPSVPKIEFEFANPTNREKYGHNVVTTSILLVDPPQLSLDEIKNNPLYRGMFQDMLKHMEIRKVLMDQARPFIGNARIVTGPSPKETKEYKKTVALYTGLGFWLKNTGPVSANDVRVQIKGVKKNELLVADKDGLPEQPRSPMEGIMAVSNQVLPVFNHQGLDVQVLSHENHWIASIDVKKIQPQAEVWIEDLLYIGSKIPMTCEVEARIFADNLPAPLEYKMKIDIKTETRFYEEGTKADETGGE
ncbi:MAG: ATP-binding protein, partial [Planctomycetes bacterium]|nr:ATP-binding protein [Planctomycetota bacterium]